MILEQAYKDGIEHGTPKPQYGYTLESYLLYIQTCGFYEVYNLTDSGFDYTPHCRRPKRLGISRI